MSTHLTTAATGPLISGSTTTPVTGWRKRAACSGADVETFFPLPGDWSDRRRALEMCGRCPVLTQCRQYAISHGERHGIWGGLTEEARERMMRRK
ncbi:WhiB family transcriptional regulator [Streptomyces sp. NPDC048282]|uniref:WhiB family transcriptional regulator n=1 Tax=unclassified Streptomyces TaxID=2593676 RepID=UPI003721AE1F